jgi:hypothetical protein
LLRILARAHAIQARLIQNPKLSVHDIAREERVSAVYLYTLLCLPWLAPDITTAICQRPKAAATHSSDIDPPHATAVAELGRTAEVARLPLRTNRHFCASYRLQSCVCRKPYPCWGSERIGYPGGMIALILFVLGHPGFAIQGEEPT